MQIEPDSNPVRLINLTRSSFIILIELSLPVGDFEGPFHVCCCFGRYTLSKAHGLWHRSRSGSIRLPGSTWEQRGRAAGHTLLAELHGALPPPHHACSHPHIRTEKKKYTTISNYILVNIVSFKKCALQQSLGWSSFQWSSMMFCMENQCGAARYVRSVENFHGNVQKEVSIISR